MVSSRNGGSIDGWSRATRGVDVMNRKTEVKCRADAGPQIVVGRHDHNGAASRRGKVYQVRNKHRIDELLLLRPREDSSDGRGTVIDRAFPPVD